MLALLLTQVGYQLSYVLILFLLVIFSLALTLQVLYGYSLVCKYESSIIQKANLSCVLFTIYITTQDLIKEINVPAIFSDYCEEASHLAASCISSVTGCPLPVPVY